MVRAARTPTGVAFDGDDVWWSESRPEEGGRIAVVRRSGSGTAEVLAAPWNARTAVHEYGGGAWWLRDSVLWFTDWATQRLHRLGPDDAEPLALTPPPDAPRGLRYADGDLSPDGSTILCVRESHPDREVRNEVVRLSAITPGEPEVVVAGPDFVACPRWRPDGATWSWIEWDHPDMPWDATRLVASDGSARTVVAGVDVRESICQADWAPDGTLWFSGDRTGFWSLYRWTPEGGVESMVELDRDIGFPHWVFGESCFAFLDDGRVAFTFVEDGADHLAVRDGDGRIERLDVPYTSIGGLRGRGSTLLLAGSTPLTEPHVVALPMEGLTAGTLDLVAPPRDVGVDPSWWSTPEPVDVPAGGDVAHALLYRPRNPTCDGPPGERPPLIVVIHGGPTSAARVRLDVGYQYWTSRGFAVVDVNHRGSTGYGRAYRELLRGLWGVVDVADCAAVARFLVRAR